MGGGNKMATVNYLSDLPGLSPEECKRFEALIREHIHIGNTLCFSNFETDEDFIRYTNHHPNVDIETIYYAPLVLLKRLPLHSRICINHNASLYMQDHHSDYAKRLHIFQKGDIMDRIEYTFKIIDHRDATTSFKKQSYILTDTGLKKVDCYSSSNYCDLPF